MWGAWLLLSDDPDGGRHAGGWFMIVVAAVLGLPTALLSWRANPARSGGGSHIAVWGVAAAVAIALLLLLLLGTP